MHKLTITKSLILPSFLLGISSAEGFIETFRSGSDGNTTAAAILSILVYDTRYLQVEFCEWKFAMTA